MKKLLFIICFLWSVAYGQTIGYLRYDSVKIYKNGGTSELILENATKGVTGGVLVNTWDGRTAFTLTPSISIPISSLTAATGANTINNVAYNQLWQWNSLSAANGLSLSSSSTLGASNSQILLSVGLSGANSNSNQLTRAAFFENNHTGTGSTNIAAEFSVNGGATNIAGRFIADGSTKYAIQLQDGTESNGYILSSDGTGRAHWTNPTSIVTGLTDTQIAYGSASNLVTSSNQFTYNTTAKNFYVGFASKGYLNIDAVGNFYSIGDMNANNNGTQFLINDNTSKGYFRNAADNALLGINTTSPDSTLHVEGGLKFVTGRQGAGKVLTSDANGGADWATASIGTVTGTGTANNMTKWTSSTAIGNALMTDDGSIVTNSGRTVLSVNGAVSAPGLTATGTWFTGGSATTTKPNWLIEPTGTTSTGWSTSGTGLGINAASGFTGNLIDLQIAGVSKLSSTSAGLVQAGYISAGGYFRNNSNDFHIYGGGTGKITLYNGAETDAAILQFGGTTSSFPALVRNGTGIDIKLADNSAYTNLTALTLTGNTSVKSPLLIGGTTTTSPLTYKTTTGVGTTGADHIFQVGNNGATEAMRILNSGNVGIGTASPSTTLDVTGTLRATTYINSNVVYGNSFRTPGGGTDVLLSSDGTFGGVNLGGSTSSFPQLRRNGTGIDIKLADNSAYTNLTALTLTGNTSVTSPLLIGGTTTTSPLTYKTTTGVGTTGADHIFQVGNNGATEAMRILNSGNVGIGTSSPASVGLLDLTSTTKGFLPPRMTTAQRTAITAIEGLIIYDTDLHKLYVYDGTTWQACW